MMKVLIPSEMQPNDGWIWFRLHTIFTIADVDIDPMALIDAASGYCFGMVLVDPAKPGLSKKLRSVFRDANRKAGQWPKALYLALEEPTEAVVRACAEKSGIDVRVVPQAVLDPAVQDFTESFNRSLSGNRDDEDFDPDEFEAARQFLPDAYDPCPCASGKKYKFCCKPVFRHIVGAMAAFEDGNQAAALRELDIAKIRVGETAEILSRYGIVYSANDRGKALDFFRRALQVNPQHPRTHYLLGLDHAENGRLKEAKESYRTAIANYPESDRYHLNESWNNLANIHHREGDMALAKEAWEKAVMYMPADKTARDNLIHFVYDNPELDAGLREPNPFLLRLLERGSGLNLPKP
jgi:Tfp pilus assembly protein PilF